MKGFKKRCISNVVNGTNNDVLWNCSEEVGMRKMRALTVKMEKVTLTCKDR